MKTRESKERKFEKKVREIGSVVLISCVCFSVEHRSSRWMVEVKMKCLFLKHFSFALSDCHDFHENFYE